MRTKCLWTSLATLCFAEPGAAEETNVTFTQIEIAEHIYSGGWEHFVGGGIAAFDCNGDALPELYAAGGSSEAQLFLNRTQGIAGTLAFAASTPDALAMTGVIGAYPIDVDGDHIIDLAILRVGEDLLLKGRGNCAFDPFETLGFESAGDWTTAFSATWERGNALPTLAFGTYVDRSNPDGPFEACDDTLLYRPGQNGYDAPLPLKPGYCALSMLFTDWSRSGRADLRISNDRHYYVRGGQEQLWAMEDVPRLYTDQDGWKPYALWGMGIASRDLTGDGYSEVYLTSMGDQKFQMLEHEDGAPTYNDVTYDFGTTAHRPYTGGDGRPSTGWHAAFGDVNNDGRDDIFVAKGNVEQMPDAAMKDPNNLLLQQQEGGFTEIGESAGIATFDRARGAALVDLNLDGTLDLAVVNRRAAMEVYQGNPAHGNWLLLELKDQTPNSKAIGAFIELRNDLGVQTREVTIGGGHASGDLGYHHFGLGNTEAVELRVIWPDGEIGGWQKVSANQRLTLKR